MTTPAFPELPAGFRFGAATAAYQIEGAHDQDGRGPSIWDTFSHTPGRTLGGATSDTACDHYHRHPQDVALLRGLGVDSYRFSIAWPRLLPRGTGPANPKGLDFYDRQIDDLLAAGVAPAVTLYHWDLPQALEDRGGWRVRETAEAFAQYAALAAERYGDRVERWITLNEPYCSAFVGYAEGRHAPGAAPLDFLGVNFYRPITVAAASRRADDRELRSATDIGVTELDPYGTRHTTMGWPVVPEALTELLRALHARYPRLPPVWITENGSAEAETTGPDGRVHDTARTDYLAQHLAAVAEAVSAGVDVRGYYVWSLLDSFEWARGYGQRFGLVHVDHDTLTRTPKDSFHWFRGLITAHRARTEETTR